MADDVKPRAEPDEESGRIKSLDDRFGTIEAEQERQSGILQQILGKLGGRPGTSGPGTDSAPAPGPDTNGKTIAELVREGVADLEAKRTREQKETDRDSKQADHDARLAALEERQPVEAAATPAGRVRAWTQKRVFGIDDPHK